LLGKHVFYINSVLKIVVIDRFKLMKNVSDPSHNWFIQNLI